MEEYASEFGRSYVNYKVNLVDLNTREGAATASLYDVMQYPAVLVLTDDGQLIREWEGDNMPALGEVNYATAI
jgi:hypothetical protein